VNFLDHTRTSYDATADDYTEWIRDELATKPLERALLRGFAEIVRGPVADIGCGPGRVTAFLHDLGLSVFGIDLSPGMIAAARRTHPTLRFEVGSMTSLDLEDGSLGGIVAWYSIIHIPDQHLPGVLAGFHRVLAPGGHLQLAFQVGDDVFHLDEARGHEVSLDFRRRRPEQVANLLTQAGFVVRAWTQRERDEDGEFPERTPQGFMLARKPPA
jgi:SAM-dependent methyltransferase